MSTTEENKEIKNPIEYTGGYWKSLQELSAPEGTDIVGGEFASTPLRNEEGTDETSRRDFLKLMGASIALSATACVRRPVQKIIPYAKAPEEIIPGVANYYASSWSYAGEGYGLLVKTREGRPIKLEGNALHPVNGGALSARVSAQILSLYDPDRLQHPVKVADGSKMTWDQVDEVVVPKLKEGGVVLLSSSLASPSTKQMIGDFFQGFKGRHVVWDAFGAEDVKAGQAASFGRQIVPRYRFDQADFVVSVDCDFLGTNLNAVENASQFAKKRKPGKNMSKLVVFESLMSLTGMNADFRVRIKPSQQIDVVLGLAQVLVTKFGASKGAGASGVLSKYAGVAQKLGIEESAFEAIAKDLWENRGKGLVVAGGWAGKTENAVDLQHAVNFLNSILDNDGKTVDFDKNPYVSYEGSTPALVGLIEDMNAGKVKTLIIHRLNPVYLLPKESGFAEALKKVELVIYKGDRVDETGALATYVAPDHHDFENWGDTEIQSGVFAIQQPTIRPLYETRSLQADLMNWAYTAEVGPKRLTEPSGWFEYLQNYWKEKSGAGVGFDDWWTKFLQDGVFVTSKNRDLTAGSRGFNPSTLSGIKPSNSEGLELVLYEKVGMGDGSSANISWLQEFPDPVSKIVWDNYIMVSPKRAEQLGIKFSTEIEAFGNVAKLTMENGESFELPVHVQPGVHDDVVGVALGYGRTVGRVAKGIGFNAWSLAKFSAKGHVLSGLKVKSVELTGKHIPLASTQGHHYLEGRPIIAEATLADYMKDEGSGIHRHKLITLWPEHKYTGHKWGMTIDLNACNGCSACVIACQSENNIPVVGKKYVLTGREMHWIRIDRYFNGDPSNPQVVVQPILCQHCDNAPCETVCPVLATVHGSEGTNDMAYNRCVGTRYCVNNCPYKVRRYNWFNYSKVEAPQNMAFNPDVTVRSRGVMEKCSFCIQRIHEGKGNAKDKGVKLKDGEIKTACQQVCPTQAIVFGDVNDPQSQVSQQYKNARTYMLLEELNVLPSVRYMSKIRNIDKLAVTPGKEHH